MEWTNLPQLPVQGLYRRGNLWYECRVLSHDIPSRMFEIELEDGKIRRIARKRLRFDFESEEEFAAFIENAENLRRSHEGFVRYFIRSELLLTQSKPRLTAQFLSNQTAIIEKIAVQLSPDSLRLVKEELWDLHRRSVHKFIFDAQYFPQTAELLYQPWVPELTKRENWEMQLHSLNLHQFPYKLAKDSIRKAVMDENQPLHLSRLLLYRRLTRIRWINFYTCLREFQGKKCSFVQLKTSFRDKFAKTALEVDSAVKQLSDNVFKILDGNTAISIEAEMLFIEAEVVLESNLQFAVTESIRTLREIVKEYYGILPLPGDIHTKFKQIPEYIHRKHAGFPATSSGKISELQSIAITKEMISALCNDLNAGKLYPQYPPNTALISVSIESKWSHEGRRHDHFSLHDIKWEVGKRREIASKFKPSSKMELTDGIKVNKVIRNVMLLTEECGLNETGEMESIRTLLPESAFGWVSAGKDKLSIDITPSLSEIDLLLQKLLTAPLKNLLRIKRFAMRSSDKQRVKVRNAAAEIRSAFSDVGEILQLSLYGPVALLGILREFDYLFSKRLPDLFLQLVKSHVNDYPGLVTEIRTITHHRDIIDNQIPDSIQFGIFDVQLRLLKYEGTRNANILIEALERELVNEHLAIMTDITKEFTELLEKISYIPQTVEELHELQAFLYVKQDESVMQKVNKELSKANIIETSLEEFHRSLPDEQLLMSRRTVAWETQLNKEKARMNRRIQRLIPNFQDSVMKQVETLKSEVLVMKADMSDFVTYSELQNADVYAAKASDVLDRFQKLKSEVEVVKNRQTVLKLKEEDFEELATMEHQFLSYHVFWNYASEWSSAYMSWMEKPLHFIDPTIVQSRFSKGLKLLDKLKAELASNLNVMKALQEQEEMLHSFESTIPLIIWLRQESLRDRHWKKIWGLLARSMAEKSETERKNNQTLRELLIKGLSKRVKDVQLIASEAENEYEIEKIWTKIDKDLKSPNIITAAHPLHKELLVIDKLAEWKDRLHESVTTINYLSKANRHIEPFKDTLKSLEQLISAQEAIVEDLHEFQELLFDLFPVFKITEISELLPRCTARMAELIDSYHGQLLFMETVRGM